MASYHFSAQIIGRSSGRSAIAAAAYRAGERLRDDRTGTDYDYSRRRGVTHSEIMAPDGAAEWLSQRQALWSHAETMEKRKDAQLAREINIALPAELQGEERLALVRGFVRDQFVSLGMVADIAWHEPVPEKGDDPRNFHAHVLLTLRQAGPGGLRRVKTREWNSDSVLEGWRAAWAVHQNRALERAGHRERVDERRLDVQHRDARGRKDTVAAAVLDRAPEIHIGPRARAADRRGHQPRSHNRTVATARPAGGSFRQARNPEKRQRSVTYPVIDQGGRQEWNARIVGDNVRRLHERADKFERQAVRLRQRHMRALRLSSMPHMRQALGMPLSPQQVALRQRMGQRHAQRSQDLLRQIERLLADILGIRDRRSRRHRSLLRGPEPTRKGGRPRD